MTRREKRPLLERMRFDRKTGELVEELSLRQRFPLYVKSFLLGLAITSAFGLLLGVVTSLEFNDALGFTWIGAGTILLLSGGARGGGYSNLSIGAVEALVGGRNRSDDDYEEDSELRHGKVMRRRDPLDRLRHGLRPPPNPAAFWSTIAGFLFIALGLPLTF